MNKIIRVSDLSKNFKKEKISLRYPFQKPNELQQASKYCYKNYEKIIKILSYNLNEIHQLDWPVRSWKILIGPWLARLIETAYEKWEVVKKLESKPNLTIYSPKIDYNFNCFDMQDFADKTQSAEWNEQIYSYLIKNYTNLKIKEKNKFYKKNKIKNFEIKEFVKKYFLIIVFKFLNIFQKKNDVVIYNSYISGFLNKIILNLKINQIPQIYSYEFYQKNKDKLKRKDLSNSDLENKYFSKRNFQIKIKLTNNKKFHKILEDLINKMLPNIYLENFEKLKSLTEKKIFPKYPKFILTSCPPIIKDEIFKCYISRKIIDKCKLIMMQHGGVYGTCFFEPTVPRHEMDVADTFCSWGWGAKQKIKKVPCSLIINDNKKWNKKGKILLIFTESRKYFTTFQCDSLWSERSTIYHNDQINLINTLPKKILNNLNFRFHPGSQLCRSEILNKVSGRNAKIIKDNSIQLNNFSEVMSQHRLLIFNYNSTGFIEGIGTNRPSILFLNNSLMPFNKKEKKIYYELNKVGILHFNHKSLIKHLNKIYLDVESWWEDKNVIKAKKLFCNRFAYSNNDYMKSYLNIFD